MFFNFTSTEPNALAANNKSTVTGGIKSTITGGIQPGTTGTFVDKSTVTGGIKSTITGGIQPSIQPGTTGTFVDKSTVTGGIRPGTTGTFVDQSTKGGWCTTAKGSAITDTMDLIDTAKSSLSSNTIPNTTDGNIVSNILNNKERDIKTVDTTKSEEWTPRGIPTSNISPAEALDMIEQVNKRTIEYIRCTRTTTFGPDPSPFKIERVLESQENTKFVSKSILKRLNRLRSLGRKQGINNVKNIYIHSDTINGGEFTGQIWYHSRNVGVHHQQTIPKCFSFGFDANNQFTEPLISQHAPILESFPIDSLQIISDMAPTCRDPNFLMSLLCGSPQGYNGPFATYIHKNYNLDKETMVQLKELAINQQQNGEISNFMTIEEAKTLYPAACYAAPLGAVLHNRQAKINYMLGLHARRRPIWDDSKVTPGNWSINSGFSYEWVHRVAFVTVQDMCRGILKLQNRLKELGFPDHTFRIWIWKDDVKSAYRIIVVDPADRWLSLWGLNGAILNNDGTTQTGYVSDTRQQFGSVASVSKYHRFAHNITAFKSNYSYIRTFYPQLGLPDREQYRNLTSPPPRHVLAEDLEKQRHNHHGQCDPLIGIVESAILDDTMAMTIDVRDDPYVLPSKCARTGIRNPAGKAHADLMEERFRVRRNLKKMMHDNGVLLRGLRRPTLIGIEFGLDDNPISMRCTDEYADSTITLINVFINNPHKAHSQKAWSTLSGKINCAMSVYYQLRCNMREFWERTNQIEWNGCASKPGHSIIKNLKNVRAVLTLNPGRSIEFNRPYRKKYKRGLTISTSSSVHTLASDASGKWGIGFVNINTGEYYFRRYTPFEQSLIHDMIFIGEAIGTFLMFMANKHHLENVKLDLFGDNEGLVKAYHKCGSKCRVVDALMCIMVQELAKRNIDPIGDKDRIEYSWMDTKEMIPYGDSLSRNKEDLFLEHFKNNHPNTKPLRLTILQPSPHSQISQAEELLQTVLEEHKEYLMSKQRKRQAKKSSKEKNDYFEKQKQ